MKTFFCHYDNSFLAMRPYRYLQDGGRFIRQKNISFPVHRLPIIAIFTSSLPK